MENNAGGIITININELSQGSYFLSGINLFDETVNTQFVKL